jgi:hypothetical protein
MTAIIPFPLFLTQYVFGFLRFRISPSYHSIITFITLKDLDTKNRKV